MNNRSHIGGNLPIPRDIVTPVMHFDLSGQYAYTEDGFICTAHSYGADRMMGGQLTQSAVSYFLYGIPIHRFVSVSIDAIAHLTDFLGGVPVEVPADFQSAMGIIRERVKQSPLFALDLYREMKPYLCTDMGLRELLFVAKTVIGNMDDIETHALPGMLHEDVVVNGVVSEFVFEPEDAFIRDYLAEVYFQPAE